MIGKFCILAAGQGTRNTTYPGLHKALLPIENIPAISRIISNVPKEMEIVIALGHLSKQVKSYVEFVHSDRNIKFVEIHNYSGKGSGPGTSLLCCAGHLDEPFIFTSVDTILPEDTIHSTPEEDWVGVSHTSPITYACLIDNQFQRIEVPPIFIGIAGIYNHKAFFHRLRQAETGEVTPGFSKPTLKNFSWVDIGSDASYEKVKTSTIVPPKKGEIVFIDNTKVVKFFSDPIKCQNIYLRGSQFLPIKKLNGNMIGYDYIPGERYSNKSSSIITNELLIKLFNPSADKTIHFESNCHLMYTNKTQERVKELLARYPELNLVKDINGISVRPVTEILENIDWDEVVSKAIPTNLFHGDPQPENIIIDSLDNIHLIDWRESFGKSLQEGDIYYDLAKLYHGCIVSNELIQQERYDLVLTTSQSATIMLDIKSNLEKVISDLHNFSRYHKLDWNHLTFLCALQYITIACLYEDEKYSKFLFLLGQLLLETNDPYRTIKLIQN